MSLNNYLKGGLSEVEANLFYHAYNERTRGNGFNLRWKIQIRYKKKKKKGSGIGIGSREVLETPSL